MKRTALIGTAALSMAAILLVGTWAWATQNAQSDAGDDDYGANRIGATLHDDYYPNRDELKTAIAENPDKKEIYQAALDTRRVFVENPGLENVYVRIMLSEYLEVDGDPQLNILGIPSITDKTTWAVRHWFGSEDLIGIVNLNNIAKFESGKDVQNPEYYPAKEEDIISRSDDNPWVENEFEREHDDTETKKPINKTEDIVTMADWWNDQRDNVWVVDTDGWMYWSSPVKPNGGTTGLLLNKIIIDKTKLNAGQPYTYRMNVQAQMGTLADERQNQGSLETYHNFFTYDPYDEDSFPVGLKFFNAISNTTNKLLNSIKSNNTNVKIKDGYIELTKSGFTTGVQTVTLTIPADSDATWSDVLKTGVDWSTSTSGTAGKFHGMDPDAAGKVLTIKFNIGSGTSAMALDVKTVGAILSIPSDTSGGTPVTVTLMVKVV